MSKFEINPNTIELIRAILRFRFSFFPPKLSPNNIILFGDSLGGRKEKRNLRIALINFIIMQFFSNFDLNSYFQCTTEIQKKRTLAAKLTYLWLLIHQN